MRFSVATIVSAAFAGFASAYTTPVGANPSGNPIYQPALAEIVPAGKTYTITWNPTTTGTITLVLLRGPSTNILPLYAIAEKVPNSGTYSWTPSTMLQPDTTHYGIQLIDDATGAYQYTSQFGVSNPMQSSSISSVAITTTTVKASAPVSQISDGQVQAATTTLQHSAVSQISDGQIQAPVTVATGTPISTTPAAISTVKPATFSVNSSAAATPIASTRTPSSPVAASTGASIPAPSSPAAVSTRAPANSNSTMIQPTGGMSVSATLRTSTFTPAGTSTGAAAAATTTFATGAAGRVAKNAGGAVVGLGALAVFLL